MTQWESPDPGKTQETYDEDAQNDNDDENYSKESDKAAVAVKATTTVTSDDLRHLIQR